jgi:MoaA/NifB/PqqE/SkfB family radical SAM enzyme
MYCCLITNGILLAQRINEIRNVDNITISLDGRKENNDKNRGEGSFAKAMEAIELVIREKIPLRVSATLTRYTMDDIGYLANLAKELGFSVHFSILFKPLQEAEDLEMSQQEIKRAMDTIIRYKKAGFPIFTSYRAASYARDWPLAHSQYHYLKRPDLYLWPKGRRFIKCHYGKIKITIEADGNVYPCFLQGDPRHFQPLNWRKVGLEKAIRYVQENNDCISCPALTQNDHNLLLDLDWVQVGSIIFEQIREAFRRR